MHGLFHKCTMDYRDSKDDIELPIEGFDLGMSRNKTILSA